MTCYDFLFKPKDDDACMDAWMHGWNLLFSFFIFPLF